MLGGDLETSGLAVLDLSDPAKPLYAEHRGDHKQNVGSVGKLVVALALFQALADLYPDDIEARRKVLKTTVVTADTFSQSDHHTVRIFDPATKTLTRRTVRIGDRATLYEWLDWMLSPSSNSAAGMVMREAMLLRHFGRAYPAPEAEHPALLQRDPQGRAVEAVRHHLPRTGHPQRAGHRAACARAASSPPAARPRCPAPATATARRAS